VYRFGRFCLDLTRGALLTVEGEAIPLRPKSFALLLLFVENPGRLLTRDAIHQAIWADVIVTDDGITQCVRDIRRALRDSTQHMLRTVPRRGFIFDAEVIMESKGLNPDGYIAASSDRPSVAVLPFANLSRQPEQEYFSDGFADDIITNLSFSSSLFVVARNSSFAYRDRPVDVKDVGRQLGVRYVVEGSVRREAERLRVNARLISAETGTNLWSGRYDRTVTEIFAVQLTGPLLPN
jgi:adenylate cyclase